MMNSRCVCCWRKGITTVGAERHVSGLLLCQWHSKGITDSGESVLRMRMLYGPSIDSRCWTFLATYGTDAELLELQERMLRGEV